ncbi:unnamed protein product, partial [Effrenium voratum]
VHYRTVRMPDATAAYAAHAYAAPAAPAACAAPCFVQHVYSRSLGSVRTYPRNSLAS